MGRRRALIVQPTLQPPGGGQAVAAWMIEALKDTYDVALVCWTPPDVGRVNRAYGTSIAAAEIAVHAVPPAIRAVVDRVPFRLALLKWSILMRLARRTSRPDDLLISADNEADFGRPGIQYVHYPRRLRPRPLADRRWYHGPTAMLDAYYAVCDHLLGTNSDIRRNVTLANSTWTAARMRLLEPRATVTVVPPPVAGDGADVPWDRRANGFLCIGRFSVEKEIEKVVAIMARVRDVYPDVRLHLVGGRDSWAYHRRVTRLARRHASWIELHEGLSRHALVELIASQRYGIHGMQEEHFGIAPAEMVRAGCVVFLPNGGGQVDIVGGEPRLLYDTPDDAVAKIVAVLNDPREQMALRERLAHRREMFSAEAFMTSIRQIVQTFAAAETGQP